MIVTRNSQYYLWRLEGGRGGGEKILVDGYLGSEHVEDPSRRMKTSRRGRVVMLILRPLSKETAGRGPYSYTLAFTIQLRKVMENLGKRIGIFCLAARTNLLFSVFHWLQPQARRV